MLPLVGGLIAGGLMGAMVLKFFKIFEHLKKYLNFERCKELSLPDNNNLPHKECQHLTINLDIILLKICNKPKLRPFNKDQCNNLANKVE